MLGLTYQSSDSEDDVKEETPKKIVTNQLSDKTNANDTAESNISIDVKKKTDVNLKNTSLDSTSLNNTPTNKIHLKNTSAPTPKVLAAQNTEKSNVNIDILYPEPEGTCDPRLQEKIKKYLSLRHTRGLKFTANLMSKKDFGNPYLLKRIVEHLNIDEIGSNLPKSQFDPESYPPEAFYEKLDFIGQNSANKIKR